MVKLTLDMAIGETSAIESTDKGKMSEISQKVRDLNGRLQDIRREQVFQRVSDGPRNMIAGTFTNMLGIGARSGI